MAAALPSRDDLVPPGRVTIASPIGNLTFDTTGRNPSDMGYVYRTVYFTNVLSGSTTLRFTSTTPSAYGPVIDAVRVESCLLVVCPASAPRTATRIS
ncbi:hypothetical protein C6361_00725 [Plantactinospora sp. BC1]|uniref:hypothetical protein n=1 Tax=Plantactinospora sp. BC1 TaxID=2108470 RepID=UPI000D166EB5|nr:hypothetical protein [Plantactinospora sp. BC1]AVT28265.1 hypothetical protein C6361_00725 [Plantactinospora sp. BC1]